MTYNEIIEKIKPELETAKNEFKSEIMKLRSSRLSPALVEDILADCFGSVMPIKQLGALSSPSPRELLIQVWDKSYVEGVVKALEREELGFGVRIDDNKIYLSSPPLTEESRKNLIQVLNKKKEEAFQELRHLRDKIWKQIQSGFQTGEVREDDKFKGRDELDKIVREKRDEMEEMAKNKENEIKG